MTTDAERLAVVEVEVKNVKDVATRIEQKIDGLTTMFASREDVKELSDRLKKIEDKNLIKSVALIITTSTSIILSIIMVYKEFKG